MRCAGRETFLVKVDWLDDWPVFNKGKNITLLTQGRDPRPEKPSDEANGQPSIWHADLDKPELELGWYQKRESCEPKIDCCATYFDLHSFTKLVCFQIDTPLKQCYSLTERPGFLRLLGNCYDLSSPEAPAMLLRKQTTYDQSFSVTLEFNPSRVGYEAGIVLWWNSFSYATVGVTLVELPSGERVHTVVMRIPIAGSPGSASVSK